MLEWANLALRSNHDMNQTSLDSHNASIDELNLDNLDLDGLDELFSDFEDVGVVGGYDASLDEGCAGGACKL